MFPVGQFLAFPVGQFLALLVKNVYLIRIYTYSPAENSIYLFTFKYSSKDIFVTGPDKMVFIGNWRWLFWCYIKGVD